VNLPFLIGLAIALYGIARETGAERLAAAAATSALLTVPMIAMLATEAYVEIPLWAMFFIAMRFTVISARPDAPPRLFLLVAGLIGLMAGTKTTGVFLGAVVFLFSRRMDLRASMRLGARDAAQRGPRGSRGSRARFLLLC